VKLALEYRPDPPRHRWKHRALEQDREQQILDWIRQNAEGGRPVTRKEIKDHCTSQFQASIAQGWANSFVLRHPDKSGILDWEDRKTRQVIVPATMRGETMHDTSWNISDRQAYFGDYLCFRCWRIAHPLHYSVARFCLGPRAAQQARCSFQKGFGHEVEYQAVYQRETLSSLHPDCALT
jgi:hypothetical protein